MARMVAVKKFSTKPEGKCFIGDEFETDRPEHFLSLGIAGYEVKPKKKVAKKRARRKA